MGRYEMCDVNSENCWLKKRVPSNGTVHVSILQVRYSCSGTHRYRYPGTCSTFNVALYYRYPGNLLYMFGRKLMRKLKNHIIHTSFSMRNFITFKFYILPPPKWSKTHSCTLNTNRFRLHVCSISCINVKGMCTIITDFFER